MVALTKAGYAYKLPRSQPIINASVDCARSDGQT